MFDVAEYWDRRYREGGTSGAGSEGRAARAKARHVARIIYRYRVRSIIDWGAGDGTVLRHIRPPAPYLGLDVSAEALDRLRVVFPRGQFLHVDEYAGQRADLALSLDVIYHLPGEEEYETYLRHLFGSADRLVLLHAADYDGGESTYHVRWRNWTPDVARWFPDWALTDRPDDPTSIGFYLYVRR